MISVQYVQYVQYVQCTDCTVCTLRTDVSSGRTRVTFDVTGAAAAATSPGQLLLQFIHHNITPGLSVVIVTTLEYLFHVCIC